MDHRLSRTDAPSAKIRDRRRKPQPHLASTAEGLTVVIPYHSCGRHSYSLEPMFMASLSMIAAVSFCFLEMVQHRVADECGVPLDDPEAEKGSQLSI